MGGLTKEIKEVNKKKKNLKPLAAGMDGALKEPRFDVPGHSQIINSYRNLYTRPQKLVD